MGNEAQSDEVTCAVSQQVSDIMGNKSWSSCSSGRAHLARCVFSWLCIHSVFPGSCRQVLPGDKPARQVWHSCYILGIDELVNFLCTGLRTSSVGYRGTIESDCVTDWNQSLLVNKEEPSHTFFIPSCSEEKGVAKILGQVGSLQWFIRGADLGLLWWYHYF